MAKFENKDVAYTQRFQVFNPPLLEQSVSSAEYIPIYPNGSADASVIEFNLVSNGVHCIDLTSSYIHTIGKIIKNNKSNLVAADVVAPSHLFGAALYSQIELYVNDVLCSDPSYYPYKAYVDSLLYYNERDRESLLKAGMYIKDDSEDIDLTKNKGFKTRVGLASLSKTWEIISPIHDGLFRVDKYLPNFVNLKIKMRRSTPAFALVTSVASASDDDYNIVFDEVIFYCKKVIPYPQMSDLYTREIQKGLTPCFQFNKAEVKNFAIEKDSLGCVSDTLISGYLPSFIIVMLLQTDAVNGSITKNSFDVKNYDLSSISAVVDSESNVQRVINVDFKKGKVLSAYLPLLEKLTELDCSNYISIEDFKRNTTLFYFNIAPLVVPGFMYPSRVGSLKLDLKFSKATENPLTVLTYANFQSIMTFDTNKNVTIEQK